MAMLDVGLELDIAARELEPEGICAVEVVESYGGGTSTLLEISTDDMPLYDGATKLLETEAAIDVLDIGVILELPPLQVPNMGSQLPGAQYSAVEPQ